MTLPGTAGIPPRTTDPNHPARRHSWNDTDRPYPVGLTMHELVHRQALRHPDAIAVRHTSTTLTYAGLERRADAWRRRLHAHGVGPGDRVGIHLDRNAELVAALLGVLSSGAAYVPLDPAYPDDRLAFMTADAGVCAIVSTDERLARVLPGTPLLHPNATPPARHHPSAPTQITAESPAYVLYTSGSTGRPKGVTLTHANAVDLLHWSAETFGDDLRQVLASTSICFDCSILEIFGPLAWGGTTVVVDSVMDVATRPEASGVRLLHSVPSVIEELLRSDRLPPAVRTAIVGGEALWANLVDKVYARSAITRLVNLYGPTECTSYATMAIARPESGDTPPIGRPIANTRIYLIDSGLQATEPGEPAEICIAGTGVASGYLGRPALTAQRFLPEAFSGRPGERMYRTGDLGRIDDNGELYFLGRIDDQVKVRGVRVEPVEVEQALLGHPHVHEAVVLAAPDPIQGLALTAYVVADLDLSTGPGQLRSYLRDRLPTPLRPSAYVFMQRLPRAPNGKIDRRRLPAAAPTVPCASAVSPAPPSGLAGLLAGYWAEEIGIAAVDVDAEVFDLGAHSLPALRVRARTAQALGEELPLRLFFEQPTVATQAAAISRILGPRLRLPDGPPTPSSTKASAATRGRLSPTQAAILSRAQARPDGQHVAVPLVVRLAGDINPTALRHALRTLQRRHHLLTDVLRGTADGTVTWQPGQPQPVPLVDLTGCPVDRRSHLARTAVERLLRRPWRLEREPPLRCAIIRMADDEHVLCVALHAIAADAWTVETVSHQILALYAGAIHGRRADDEGDGFAQYQEVADERRALLESPVGERQRRHWQRRLRGLAPLRLTSDSQRTADPGSSTQTVCTIPAPIVESLQRAARTEGATPFMALLAAFAMVLHHRSGQDDIAIGCPTSGRLRPELATVVGPCMDAIVIRADLTGRPTFRALLRRLREQALEAYANADVPFVELAATAPADSSRHPLFQASIVMQQRPSLLDPSYSAELAWRH
ncbi:amino acid adenylation domain-containing protein, partial [Micromonospora sp. NPDC051296]|uniref:amino acid adenylation domain-containing protein n=1 Tax=Micromonospora sp. NPDC051296 TaxID=3155046 RepID=UPI0034302359